MEIVSFLIVVGGAFVVLEGGVHFLRCLLWPYYLGKALGRIALAEMRK